MSNRVYARAGELRVTDRFDAEVHATLQMVASPKEVLSRIMTKPNGRLVRAEYVVRNEREVTTLRANLGDFCAKSPVPEGAERVRLSLLVRGGATFTSISVNINLLTGSIDIFGKYGTVSDLTGWLHVPSSDFKIVRA